MLNASIRSIPLPQNMLELPVSKQGFPVPFFAGKNEEGEWDFRVVHPETTVKCMRQKLCWVCGQQLGRVKAFVAGPMCVVTRTSAEPPCHPSCARYAAIACPFLASPRMQRNEKDLPEGHRPPAGQAIMRNPGVAAVLVAEDWRPFNDGNGGVLIQMGAPTVVEWYAQRRNATQKEVMDSIESGLHLLREQCEAEQNEKDKRDAHSELSARVVDVCLHWLPRPGPGEADLVEPIRRLQSAPANTQR
jgi:hypothetical protein